jgi:hypothetical protein
MVASAVAEGHATPPTTRRGRSTAADTTSALPPLATPHKPATGAPGPPSSSRRSSYSQAPVSEAAPPSLHVSSGELITALPTSAPLGATDDAQFAVFTSDETTVAPLLAIEAESDPQHVVFTRTRHSTAAAEDDPAASNAQQQQPQQKRIGTFAMIDRINSGRLPAFPSSFSPTAQDFLARCLRTDAYARESCRALLDHPFLQGVTAESATSYLEAVVQQVTRLTRDAARRQGLQELPPLVVETAAE